MPELHIQRVGELLLITLGERRSTVAWSEVAAWKADAVRKHAEDYGHALFEQITRDAGLREALMGLPQNERLVLVADEPEVAAVPWEYLRFPKSASNLLLATRYNLVRGIAESRRRDRVVPESPLTIVAVPVSPVIELVALNTEGEWHDLTKTIRARGKALTLVRVRPPTVAAMGGAASAEGTSIVHFMGHSGVIDGQGVLFFENDVGKAEGVNAADFVNDLDVQHTFLVVLNSCYSAQAASTSQQQDALNAGSSFGNIAQAVVRERVPYALGMQFALPDDAALKITEFLYDALLKGLGVEEAVRRVCSKLQQSSLLHNAQWLAGVPVLYTSLREPAPAIQLATGQPTIQPDPVRLAQTRDLSALSSSPEHFIGRSDLVSEVLALLQNSSTRGFITLRGIGGIGKTTLARAIATRISWHYEDHVLAYSFETFATFEAEGDKSGMRVDKQFAARFYSKLAEFYALEPRNYETIRDVQRAILQQRTHMRSLLILDNIETLISAQNNGDTDALALASFVRDLRNGDGNVLLTTRDMPPSDWGHCEDIHLLGLSDDAGAELFLASIADDRKDAASYSDRCALSHYVQGHPLCIGLLAGRFSDDSASTLTIFLQNIQDELTKARQKTPSSADDPRRQASIGECLDYSIHRLTPEQKKVLYTLGIFRAPFLLSFAEDVLDDEEQTTEKYLQDLVRLDLLEQTYVDIGEEGYFEQYELHPLVRWHIKPHVATLNTETRQRYAQVYEYLARHAWGPQVDYEQSVFMRYLLRQSLPDCEAVLEDENVEPVTQSSLAYHLAEPYERMGQVQHALALCKKALKIKRGLGDVRGVAVMQHALAWLLAREGQVQEAMQLYKQSLKAMQELGDVREIAVTRYTMAWLLAREGQVQEAMQLYKQSLKTSQELGEVRGIAMAQASWGYWLWQEGEYGEALAKVWWAYKSLSEDDFPRDTQGIRGYLVEFKEHFSGEEQEFDVLWLQATSELQPAWLQNVQVGGSSSQDTIPEDEIAEISQAIVALIEAENWEATQCVVEERQEVLFKPVTELLFEHYIEQAKNAGDQQWVETLEMHLDVLGECQRDGIAQTFARIRAGEQQGT